MYFRSLCVITAKCDCLIPLLCRYIFMAHRLISEQGSWRKYRLRWLRLLIQQSKLRHNHCMLLSVAVMEVCKLSGKSVSLL